MAKTTTANTETRKADIGKLIKATILGPMSIGVGGVAAYMALLGITKAFLGVHSFVMAKVLPWIVANWWVVAIIWCIIAASGCWYYIKAAKKAAQKAAKKAAKAAKVAKAEKVAKQNATKGEMPEHPIIKKDEAEGLGVSARAVPLFSAETVFGSVEKTSGENEPYTFISMGASEDK